MNPVYWLVIKRKHILHTCDISPLHVHVRLTETDTLNLHLYVPNCNYSIVMC